MGASPQPAWRNQPARDAKDGEVAEWLKAHAWKVCLRETVTRVRIPLSPPYWLDKPSLSTDQTPILPHDRTGRADTGSRITEDSARAALQANERRPATGAKDAGDGDRAKSSAWVPPGGLASPRPVLALPGVVSKAAPSHQAALRWNAGLGSRRRDRVRHASPVGCTPYPRDQTPRGDRWPRQPVASVGNVKRSNAGRSQAS